MRTRAVKNFRMTILALMEIGGRISRGCGAYQPQRATNAQAPASGAAVAVQPFAHFLARLEERDALLIDRHMGAGTWIAAGARRAVLHRERAETAQLDPVAARQRSDDLIEDRVHDILDIPLVKMRVVLGDTLNKFGFDHRDWDPGTCSDPFP